MTISVADRSVMTSLRKVLRTMNGVSILPTPRVRARKTGLDEAIDDMKHGRVTEYASVDDMFEKLGI